MMTTDQLRVDPAYRQRLLQCGLTRVGDILDRVDGRVFAWSRTTDTLYVPCHGGGPGFFVKRYYYPRWRNRLRGAFRGTYFGLNRALAEFRSLNTMRRLGVPAVRPVAHGSRRIAHFVQACFLITEEVPASLNLTTFARSVQRGRIQISRHTRRAMVTQLAAQVAEMHRAGFAHGQLFWRNVLVRTGPDGRPEFFFLDAQPPRRMPVRRAKGRWWVRELADIAASAAPFVRRSERLRFVMTYFGAVRLTPQLKADLREIELRSAQFARHEKQRIKMNDLFEDWSLHLASEDPSLTGMKPDEAAT